jgi:hypothetical protein
VSRIVKRWQNSEIIKFGNCSGKKESAALSVTTYPSYIIENKYRLRTSNREGLTFVCNVIKVNKNMAREAEVEGLVLPSISTLQAHHAATGN